MSKRSIHDNNIYAYSIRCQQKQIVLHTEYHDPRHSEEEYTDVTFNGVVAHYFRNVLDENILFSIDEVDVEFIVREWAELFAKGKNYDWPEGIVYEGTADLIAKLRGNGIRGYRISSSYGLSGWVLASEMILSDRTARADGNGGAS